MNIRRGKKINELDKTKKKIIEFVENGDLNSAQIYVSILISRSKTTSTRRTRSKLMMSFVPCVISSKEGFRLWKVSELLRILPQM